jgi:hypothetical protein
VISAAEIADYTYCALSWQFGRTGRNTRSASSDRGMRIHAEVGKKLFAVEKARREFWLLTILGYALLALALIILLGWLR